MLILEVLLGLCSKQGDVTAAFVHALIDSRADVYVAMPHGFGIKGITPVSLWFEEFPLPILVIHCRKDGELWAEAINA